ncbi:maleylpyruvate isomerase N-terminal domain-containing protein [Hymenobacter sp. BT188]|uniref:maleylpyruvate isomerase N-terminal domain-containing protein n=1 Tax=Hymenobacter sp. BT188 TaxID=2763504 RepID=UPI0016514EC7|nr:maleylpyruvate isomerase N-terminal domain-containing protein [Hymenobacter sp. BT188]MBC6609012.1 maleylpyruvate isomerase N-terminal domain-containing protein [Hymenobacter sp. BT188]
MSGVRPVPIETLHLFPVLDEKLLSFLRGLQPADWELQTLAPKWKVMDVALHLMAGNLQTLSMLRDGYFGVAPADPTSYEGIVQFLNELNADWIKATRRLSPRIVMEMLESTGREYTTFLRTLDPWQTAGFSVGWAGEQTSLNWFHIARDYTEKWHHQQQIRQAVGRGEDELLTPTLYQPFLATCMRALPHHYRHVSAEPGQTLRFTVTGEGGGTWFLQYNSAGQWELQESATSPCVAVVTIDGTVAWRLFTKSLPRTQAEAHVQLTGDKGLGEQVFNLIAIMG